MDLFNNLEIWKALYIDGFDTQKYLYHYTSTETAIKILHSNTLLFGKLSNANDTTESKIRISFDSPSDTAKTDYSNKCDAITQYLREKKDGFQMLCFSTDTCVSPKKRENYLKKISEESAYYDVYGRGFALPRMWAQYAQNHNGVCFVFDKEKILKKVNENISFCPHGHVHYADISSTYHISESQVNSIYNKVKNESNGNLPYLNEMKKNDFLRYNFFEKSADWSNEQEYRIIIYTNSCNAERQKISDLADAVEGIVIGERMDDAYIDVLQMLFEKSCKGQNLKKREIHDRIMRISFEEQICRLNKDIKRR